MTDEERYIKLCGILHRVEIIALWALGLVAIACFVEAGRELVKMFWGNY